MSEQAAEQAERDLLRRLANDAEAVERIRLTLRGIDRRTGGSPERVRAALLKAAADPTSRPNTPPTSTPRRARDDGL